MLREVEKKTIAFKLAGRFGWKCWYCNKPLKPRTNDGYSGLRKSGLLNCRNSYPHLDHIKPICEGGTDDLDNLALSCGFCNMAKGAAPVEQFLDWLDTVRFGVTKAPIDSILSR